MFFVFGIINGTDNLITCPSIQRSQHLYHMFCQQPTNYTGWLPNPLRDIRAATLCSASRIHVRQCVVFKSKWPFSAMDIDQAQEHTNVVIKFYGKANDITDDASALRRWIIA